MIVVTIEIPDHQSRSTETIAKIVHHVAHSLEDKQFKNPHDSETYSCTENHVFLSSIGDTVYSVKRGVD